MPELRHQSVAYKAGAEFLQRITDYVERFREHGPYFTTLSLGDNVLISRAELEHMYREEFKILSPAQRLNRLNLIVESRLENWEKTLYPQYEKQLIPSYRDKELAFATRMAVAQRLRPLRAQARQLFDLNPLNLFAQAMRGAPAALKKAAYENANAGLIWWEDAPAIGYIMLRLGFVKPDTGIRHLLIDEAQDYPDIFLKFLAANYPSAHATLLGDPNQRTLSSLPPCDPQVWGSLMGSPDAPLVELRCGYRSTVQIGDYCNAFLGKEAVSNPYGRSGKPVEEIAFSQEALESLLTRWRKAGHKRVALVTRSQKRAEALSKSLKGSFLLTGDVDELEDEGVIVSALHLMKGLEFDAVAVIWPERLFYLGRTQRKEKAVYRLQLARCMSWRCSGRNRAMAQTVDLAVIGGGASGLMAACSALMHAKRPLRVVVLEKQERVGRKLAATGNGRCNLTNTLAGPRQLPHERQPVLPGRGDERLPARGGHGRVPRDGPFPGRAGRGAGLPGKRPGCVGRGRAAVLPDRKGRRNPLLAARVTAVSRAKDGFSLRAGGETLFARRVVLAAGSQAAPRLGGGTDGYRLGAVAGARTGGRGSRR